MSTQTDLVAAYIAAQAALRSNAGAAMAAQWTTLASYNRADIPSFLASAVPIANATKAASVRITSAYLSRRLGIPALGVNPQDVTIRNGIAPQEVYARPFVTVWADLKDGKPYQDAVAAGLHRATSAVQTDAQLAMRETLRVAGTKTDKILGYRRVPDPGACEFCKLVAGQRYTTEMLMPVHNHCGCGVDVITAENRDQFTGKRENDLNLTRITHNGVTAAIVEHGELGPLVVNGDDHFTSAADIAA
ncbi:MAG: VG15 protein [Solirubrobacteraceae bacterium]